MMALYSARISWANWHIPMTNLLNYGCKSTPQEMLPNHRPTQKHPSPSVGKLLPNKSLFSTSQAQRAIISPTTGASAMVPPAKLCEAISLHEDGCLFSLFHFRGFCPHPQINTTTICQRGLHTKTSSGLVHSQKQFIHQAQLWEKKYFFMPEPPICFTSMRAGEWKLGIHQWTSCLNLKPSICRVFKIRVFFFFVKISANKMNTVCPYRTYPYNIYI